MVLLLPVAVILFGIIALALLIAGAKGASLSEFADRPLCWVLGHPAPGSPLRYVTEHKTPMGVLPAEVWLCTRCDHLVTLVGPAMRGDR